MFAAAQGDTITMFAEGRIVLPYPELDALTAQVAQLADALGLEQTKASNLEDRVAELQAGLAAAQAEGDRQAGLPLASQSTPAGFKFFDPKWTSAVDGKTPLELHQNGDLTAWASRQGGGARGLIPQGTSVFSSSSARRAPASRRRASATGRCWSR